MRWVLIRPRNLSPYYDPEVQEPLGLEYLSSSLQEMGDSVLILDCSLDGLDETRVARRALSFLPDAIGFSLTTAQELKSVGKIYSECCRSCDPGIIGWVAGGNFVSTEPNHAERLLPANMHLIRFEGETALARLRDMLLSPDPNIGKHASESRIPRQLMAGDPVSHLDQLPFPSRPFARKIVAHAGALNLQASRGCCGSCVFCASPGMARNGRNQWRARSIENIVDEIELSRRKYDARSFNFVDEDFLGANKQSCGRGTAFAEEILRRELDITFSIQVRPDSLSLTTINSLAKAGLSFVFMGLETDSADLLHRWNRPIVRNPWRFVQRFREKGVEVNVGAMLFHKDATFQGIRTLAQKLDEYEMLNYRSATNRQVAMPGSRLHASAVIDGNIDGNAIGPQMIVCTDSRVESLYSDLLAALAPLGPPSMEAVCALPRVVAQKRLNGDKEDHYSSIKRIDRHLRQPVMHTLSCLIDHHEQGGRGENPVKNLRESNFHTAMSGVAELSQRIGRVSIEELREAIRTDAGI